jgi:hypothetical protein
MKRLLFNEMWRGWIIRKKYKRRLLAYRRGRVMMESMGSSGSIAGVEINF